ncbi:MAG: serine/threonine-protein kinase [Gemmatimonadaceae bacterium]
MSDIRARLESAVGSHFTIERELGGGGMSRVFLAEERRFGRKIVIKVLTPELTADLSAERFEREISLAAGLQDPHIVPVLSAGVAAGLPYYTMPFVDGESLRARLTAVGPQRLPVVDAVTILRDVAAALEYAHGRGVVHRDIKPENVLLAGRMAVVTDFGIAKAVSAATTVAGRPGGTLTQAGVSLGTPGYMAPEQVAGDEVDQRADIYAWGVMAYEVLVGAHPFAPGCDVIPRSHWRLLATQTMRWRILGSPIPMR